MRSILAAIAVCLAVPALAVNVQMDDAEQAACDAEGGCVFATKHHLADLLRQAFDAGVKRGQEKCSA